MTPVRKKRTPPTDSPPGARRRIRGMAWLWTAVVALLWFALSWESIGGGTGFTGVVFIFLSLAVATPLTLASVTFLAKNTKPEWVRVFGPLGVGIWLGLGSFILISPQQERWSTNIAMKRGDSLIQALDEFKEENGSYPKQLSDLTPQYLPSIPYPHPCLFPSDKFSYADQGDHFSLTFPTGLFDDYHWNRADGWYLVRF